MEDYQNRYQRDYQNFNQEPLEERLSDANNVNSRVESGKVSAEAAYTLGAVATLGLILGSCKETLADMLENYPGTTIGLTILAGLGVGYLGKHIIKKIKGEEF